MTVEFTDKEFRRLLDLVYIGNWILNSTRGEDRFEDYDLLQEKFFALSSILSFLSVLLCRAVYSAFRWDDVHSFFADTTSDKVALRSGFALQA